MPGVIIVWLQGGLRGYAPAGTVMNSRMKIPAAGAGLWGTLFIIVTGLPGHDVLPNRYGFPRGVMF